MNDRVRIMKSEMPLVEALTIAAACGRGEAQRYTNEQMIRAADRLAHAHAATSREDIVEELLRRGIPLKS